MKINKIYRNKIYLDTEEIIDINKDIEYEYNLKSKINNDISDIYEDVIRESIKNKSYFLIALKDRTRKELFDKLKSKYISRNISIINEVLDDFEDNGYINDINYAIYYIENNTKYGKRRIMSNLMMKGIDINDINTAFSELDTNEIEINNIIKIIKSKRVKFNEDKNKIFQMLMRKGYNYDDILKVFDDIKNGYVEI